MANEGSHPGEEGQPRLAAVAGQGAQPSVLAGAVDWASSPLWRDGRIDQELADRAARAGRETNAQEALERAEAEERLLVRLGLDLHDGPLQDFAFLTSDLRLFREQLGGVLGAHGERDRILGRIDDLEARLLGLSGDLRRLAFSLTSSRLLEQPFRKALQAEVEALERDIEIRSTLTLQGSFSSLTSAQRIALVRIVREALLNVREHSGARTVEITIAAGGGVVRAEVVDDGRGFDVAEKLADAVGRGRLGIAGMVERARLLGGELRIDSTPGGPTRLEVALGTTPPEPAG